MTPAQGDAILDVFDHCSIVTAAWNQRMLVARNTKRKTGAVKALTADVSKSYEEAKERLAALFHEAVMVGCDHTTVTSVLLERLPTNVLRDIMAEIET